MIIVGDIIQGQYKLVDYLGGGRFGEVYLAKELVSEMRVAIKILTEKGKLFQQNFEKEARIMARLRHPNIVQLLGAFSEEPNHFLVLEYCDGGNLADVIHRSGKLPEERALGILNQVCAGLAFAHTYRFETITGIIHRDLKPQNLFLTGDDVVKIGDFGVSRMAAGSQKFSTAIGTPEYMAPEQFDGRYDFRADIYALGIILYQMVVGKTPFSGTFAQVMKRHLTEKPNIPPTVSQHVRSIIETALAKQPEQRYQTVAELQEALKPKPAQTEPITEWAAPQPETVAEKEFLKTAEEIKPKPAGEPTIRVKARSKAPEISQQPSIIKMNSISITSLLRIGLALLAIAVLFYFVFGRKEKDRSSLQKELITIQGIEFVHVPGGEFLMGSNAGEAFNDEKPMHKVYVDDFYIGKYEVTQKQWAAVMRNNLSYRKGNNLPVENVSWQDVQEFIHLLNAKTDGNFRLPTEAEWEYAARGGKKSQGYKYSGSNNLDMVAWYDRNSGQQSHPVGTKQPNELEIYDMTGNVWEWCEDWYGKDYYSQSTYENPKGPTNGFSRVFRGSSFDYSGSYCRLTSRGQGNFTLRNRSIGFRLVFIPKNLNKQKATQIDQPISTTMRIQNDPITIRGIEYIFVKGGEFLMGSDDSYASLQEKPMHKVQVDDFYISKYEVTNEQYCNFLNERGNQTEGGTTWLNITDSKCQIVKQNGRYIPKLNYHNYPAILVTWLGANAFCKWAGGRLPTEAEWEYAARGGNKSKSYKYSGSNYADDVAWYSNNSQNPCNIMWYGRGTHSVGLKKPNELGLYDMSGNAAEMCSDWYGWNYYEKSPQYNPKGPTSGDIRVLRGGCFLIDELRITIRNGGIEPNSSSTGAGFRVVLDSVF